MMKQTAAILLAAAILAGCSGNSMPKVSEMFSTPSVTESYVSNLSDIAVPAPMESRAGNSLVTVDSNGKKVGLESFAGRADFFSLAKAMQDNMARMGWTMTGSTIGVRSIQIYTKDEYTATILYSKGPVRVTMDVWVVKTSGGN